MDPTETPFAGLTPETILDAVESKGRRCSGQLLALNSYENRVYQVGLEEDAPLVAKFYRPGRWSDAGIREEHAFTLELADHELPVVPPLADASGETLSFHDGWRFALFRRQGGRLVDLDDPERRRLLGRLLGRLHACGATRPFSARPTLTVDGYGHASLEFLLEGGFVPDDLVGAYRSVAGDVLGRVEAAFDRAGTYRVLRLHGDCHAGNLLWTDDGVHLVDLDDCLAGPAVQDLWMLLSGSREAMSVQLGELLEGYRRFHDFDPRELHLVEALRSLRLLHHAAWIARRWNDPAFPRAFPWFGDQRFWQEQVLALREQIAALDEGPLELPYP
ncbi:MAG: serine/threonine protein kinase [Gammaproteobacteria bacterium]|nr:serine/threonine protein kinase [Gammaproteobacteria bacterium]